MGQIASPLLYQNIVAIKRSYKNTFLREGSRDRYST